MPPLINVRNLKKIYRLGEVDVNALVGVTVAIERGSYVAVMGPSGSGKSTFMNLLGCLDQPTSGRYLLDGIPVESLDRDQLAEIRNQKISFVFQNFNLLPRMSAMENVELPLLYKDNDTPDADEQAEHSLTLVGLAGRGCDRRCLRDCHRSDRLRRHAAYSAADREHRQQHHHRYSGEYDQLRTAPGQWQCGDVV